MLGITILRVISYYVHVACLQSSLRDILDLSEFSCKEVTLSLAVVNGIGSSQFISYPSPIYIHGGICILTV